MRFQLNGSVEVRFHTAADSVAQSLFFEAEDFQAIDGTGITTIDGRPGYEGWLDAIEDNIQVRLWVVADASKFREKRWVIESIRDDVREPAVAEDKITFEFVESGTAR